MMNPIIEKGCDKEEYMKNPVRESIPWAERILKVVIMEGSFGTERLNSQ